MKIHTIEHFLAWTGGLSHEFATTEELRLIYRIIAVYLSEFKVEGEK